VVVASLPHEETLFEYLVGCWNRNNAARAAFSRQVGVLIFISWSFAYILISLALQRITNMLQVYSARSSTW
jgi:hypothetical protein